MSSMKKTKLSEIYEFQYGKGNVNPDNGGKYPVYGAGGIIGYYDQYNSEDSPIIGHMGAYCGKVTFGKGKHFVTYNGVMALVKGENNPVFGYYLLLNSNIDRSVRGAAQPFISYDLLKDIDILLPNIDTQNKIGHIFSILDGSIDNNKRKIEILEELTQLLYREWFVEFRFPGYEKQKFVESEMGKIPEGWKIETIGDWIKVKKGKMITSKTITDGNVPVVAGGLEPAYYHNTANVSAPAATISASGANSGFVNLYSTDIWASDCSYISKKQTPFVCYYYLQLKTRQLEVTNLQMGAAQPHVYPKDLMKLETIYSGKELIKEFESLVGPMFELMDKLKLMNNNLSRTRDLLLPKLMSGEIDVSKIDIKGLEN